jgi:Mn-dependent DtxR family transcriptional regulator
MIGINKDIANIDAGGIEHHVQPDIEKIRGICKVVKKKDPKIAGLYI